METLFSIFSLGLVFLIVAWAVQLLQVKKGKKQINKYFMIIYCVGLILIVVDGLIQGLLLAPILNAIALLLILITIVKNIEK